MTDYADVTQPTTDWSSGDHIVIDNPGFEDVTAGWPDEWTLTLGNAAQASAKTGDPSDAQ